MIRSGARASTLDPTELLSVEERGRYLQMLRAGLGVVGVLACALAPGLAAVPVGWIAGGTAAYLAITLAFLTPVGRSESWGRPLLHAGLLLDGIGLGAIVALTGGAGSPLRFLMFVHVAAVTLLASYRTGLKLAVWHSMLFLLAAGAIDAGLVPHIGSPPPLGPAAALSVAGLWVLAFATAASSAAGERELRRQKHDLERLSAMVSRIERTRDTDEIPAILLDELCRTFGFHRGVVVRSTGNGLRVLASTERANPRWRSGVPDLSMTRAWDARSSQLVRRIDPAIDPHLAALLPDARGVVVIPLFFEGGRPLGVVALEHGGGSAGLRRWVVSMAAQFATHGALALHNAWLLEDRAGQLRTISRLDRQLRAQNAELEEMVAERTTELRQVIEDLRETDRQRRRLLEHVVHVAEEERRRIANDIHDDPVQKMVALKMRLELLAKSRRDVPELERIFRDVTETIRSLRNLLFDLRPPILDEEGIAAAIRYFLENAEVPFRWSVVDGLDVEPPAGVRLILYRIAQEALVNARKHADADTVRVTIAERDGGVWMEVADDGVGFTPQDPAAAAGHMGLAAMRERAEVAGGRCALRSLPNAGTTLEVWLPSDTPTTTVPTSGEPAEPTADVVTLRVDRIA